MHRKKKGIDRPEVEGNVWRSLQLVTDCVPKSTELIYTGYGGIVNDKLRTENELKGYK